MPNYKPPHSDWVERHGATPIESIPHGTEDDITEKMKGTVHGDWVQMGNVLICRKCPNHHQTEPIPTEYLLKGTDNKGLPILEKLKL